ncbi:hypothetical protein EBN03_08370 [Nocardia stercoris]|uniref:Uncharacterized protein n=1 Tax=Nocardia stercoris TaxID=2483361 RepID=A0A3M2LB87_9NOCA|nr:hypothetical protein EBN03_08370 [Nocardia stercoris]
MGRLVLGPDVEGATAQLRAILPEDRFTELTDDCAALDFAQLSPTMARTADTALTCQRRRRFSIQR